MQRERSTLRGWPVVVVAVALIAGVTGCATGSTGGGSLEGDNGSSSGSQTTTSSSPDGSGSKPSDQPTKKPKKKNVIKWTLGLGVGSPEGPAFDYLPSYTALSEGNCGAADDNAQNESLKYVVAAAKACQAAKGESADPDADWAAAREVRDGSTPLGCVDAVVFLALDRLLDAHDVHPDRQFTFKTGGDSTGEPRCPEITSVEPDEAAAGEVVALRGVNLGDVTGVTLDGESVEVVNTEDSSVEVRVPEGQSESVDLVVESPRNQWQLVAHLKIRPDADESDQTDPPTPTESPDGSGGE